MYKMLCRFVFVVILFGWVSVSFADLTVINSYLGVRTQERQDVLTPHQVLLRLQQGNQRFVEGRLKNRDLLAEVHATKVSQYPLAVILNCMDSRTAPEIVFDQGVGDIFTIRVAGNVVNDDVLGSMEYGTKVVGAKVVAVIGHTSCGAVRGACQHVKLGHLSELLQKIKPAVDQAVKQTGTSDCANATFVDEIAKDNVLLMIKQILARSPVLKKLVEEGKLEIVGGFQDITTGKVEFFDH